MSFTGTGLRTRHRSTAITATTARSSRYSFMLVAFASLSSLFFLFSTNGNEQTSDIKPIASNYYKDSGASLRMAGDNLQSVDKGEPIMLSLWLMPPPYMVKKIQAHIDELAKGKGPTFIPHVTIISGIQCYSEEEVQEMAKKLQEGLKGFGKVPCSFGPVPYSSKGHWSQGLFLVMDMAASLMNLCQKSRIILGMDAGSWRFAPPAGLPHLSLFYGIGSDIPDKKEVEPVQPFHSISVALWKTDPSTLEGVPNWKEVAVINLA
jgi:hypothetical protein